MAAACVSTLLASCSSTNWLVTRFVEPTEEPAAIDTAAVPPATAAPNTALPAGTPAGAAENSSSASSAAPAADEVVPKNEPYIASANRMYFAYGRTHFPFTDGRAYRDTGPASIIEERLQGQPTASGELYDMNAMTIGHPRLPIPSYARVSNRKTKASVVVRVNDRGPVRRDHIVALSQAVANKIGVKSGDDVELIRITPVEISQLEAARGQTPRSSVIASTADTATPTAPGTPAGPQPASGAVRLGPMPVPPALNAPPAPVPPTNLATKPASSAATPNTNANANANATAKATTPAAAPRPPATATAAAPTNPAGATRVVPPVAPVAAAPAAAAGAAAALPPNLAAAAAAVRPRAVGVPIPPTDASEQSTANAANAARANAAATKSAASTGRYAVQVGVYTVAALANDERDRIAALLAKSTLSADDRAVLVVRRTDRLHVVVGDLEDRASADALAKRVRRVLQQDVTIFRR